MFAVFQRNGTVGVVGNGFGFVFVANHRNGSRGSSDVKSPQSEQHLRFEPAAVKLLAAVRSCGRQLSFSAVFVCQYTLF